MRGVWTITYNNVEKTVAAWGLTTQPLIRTHDRSATQFSFCMTGQAPESGVPFASFNALLKAGATVAQAEVQARVTIRQYGAWTGAAGGGWSNLLFTFVGYLANQPGTVGREGQSVVVVFKDAIWLMQNTTFQQPWVQNPGGMVAGNTYTIYSAGTTNFMAVGAPNNLPGTEFIATGTATGTGLVTVPISRCVLFMDINSWVPNVYQSVQWQVNQILSYAASCGIAIAPGTIEYSGWYLNYYHCRAISIWEALLKCFEPIASAKIWVDGSAATPLLHIRSRAALAALAAPGGTGPGPVTLLYKGVDAAGHVHETTRDFEPRYDLVPPQVVLQYQINTTLNGKPAPIFTTDVYPAGANGQMPFALVAPVDLTGASETIETGTLDCEPLACVGGSHAAKRAWWASKRGGEEDKLADFRVRFGANTIGDATVVDDNGNAIDLTQYPNRIAKGTYHAWMKNGSTQINAIRAHVKVKVQFQEYDVVGSTPAETDTNGNLIKTSNAHELHCHITLTNAPAGVTAFTGANVSGYSETPVSGLAQNIWTDRATLDYDGDHEFLDPGVPGVSVPITQIIGHWNVLNIAGGAAAWANANMTIAATEIDLLNNRVRIQVGPARHLQPQDWSAMLQFFRYRRTFMFSSQRATGAADPNGTVDMALNTPDGNTVGGLVADRASVLIDYATPSDPTSQVNGRSNLDANQVTQILAAETPTPVVDANGMRTLQPREYAMCDNAGDVLFVILHGTSGHTKA
jgi:hypothetical protein